MRAQTSVAESAASPDSRVPEVRPVRPSIPTSETSDADIKRQVDISNAKARDARKERRRGASLLANQMASSSFPSKNLQQPQESDVLADSATVSNKNRRRQQRKENEIRQAKNKDRQRTEDFLRITAEARDPRHVCEPAKASDSATNGSTRQTKSAMRQPRSECDTQQLAEVPDELVAVACDAQLEIWQRKLRFAGHTHM